MDQALDFSLKRPADDTVCSPAKRERLDSGSSSHSSPQQPSSTCSPTSLQSSTPLKLPVAGFPGSPFGALHPFALGLPALGLGAFGGGDPSAFLPATASLAMSTLNRRRRRLSAALPKPTAVSPFDSLDGDHHQRPAKKQGQPVDDKEKDDTYWERRRKNNDAAKRSRDSRRRKEEEVATRAAQLESENLQLRAQVAVLKNETARLHFMLLSNTQRVA